MVFAKSLKKSSHDSTNINRASIMYQIEWLQGVTLYQAILGKDMYRQIVMNTSDLIWGGVVCTMSSVHKCHLAKWE